MDNSDVTRRSSVFTGQEGQEFREATKLTITVLKEVCDGADISDSEEKLRECGVLDGDTGLMDHVCSVLEDTSSKLQESESNLLRAAEYGTFLVEEHRRDKEGLDKEVENLRVTNAKLLEERDALSSEIVLWKGWDVKEYNNEICSDEQSDLSDRERDMLRIKNQLQNEVNKLHKKNMSLEVEKNALMSEIGPMREENARVLSEMQTIDGVNKRLGKEVSFVRKREIETRNWEEAQAKSPVSPSSPVDVATDLFDVNVSDHMVLESFLETPVTGSGLSLRSVSRSLVQGRGASCEEDEGEAPPQMRSRDMLRIRQLQADIDDWQQKLQETQMECDDQKDAVRAIIDKTRRTMQHTARDISGLREEVVQLKGAMDNSILAPLIYSHLALQEYSILGESELSSIREVYMCNQQTSELLVSRSSAVCSSTVVPEVVTEVAHTQYGSTDTISSNSITYKSSTSMHDEVEESIHVEAKTRGLTALHISEELSTRDRQIEELKCRLESASSEEVEVLRDENARLVSLLAKSAAETVSVMNAAKEGASYKETVTRQLNAAELECSVLKQEVAMLNMSITSTEGRGECGHSELREQVEKQAAELRMRNAEFKSLLLEHKQLSDARGHELGNEKYKLIEANRKVQLLEATIHRLSEEALNQKEEREILKRSRGNLLVKVQSTENELLTLRSQRTAASEVVSTAESEKAASSTMLDILDKYRGTSRRGTQQLQLRTFSPKAKSPKSCISRKEREVPLKKMATSSESTKAMGGDLSQYELDIINGVNMSGTKHASTMPSYQPERKTRSVHYNTQTCFPPQSIPPSGHATAKQPLHAIVQKIAADVGKAL